MEKSDTPCCANCSASLVTGPGQIACRAHPPAVLFMGMRELPLRSGTEPVIGSYFPPMQPNGWCREWIRKMDA